MEIIKELDKEGINLQETRLNLIKQEYEWCWEEYVGGAVEIVMSVIINQMILEEIMSLFKSLATKK